MLAGRLIEVLADTISCVQGTFVREECFRCCPSVRKKNDGGLFFKIDFEKDYDHVK